MVRNEAYGGEAAVDMGMTFQTLVPGVKDAEESDLSCRVCGSRAISSSVVALGAEQKVIDHPLLLQSARESDAHVEIML